MPNTASSTIAERPRSDRAGILARAVVAVADRLGISQAELARILGLSRSSVSRMTQSNFDLDPDSKEGELGLLFVRLYRSLDSIVGTDAAARSWLQGDNAALGARPADLIRSVAGLVDVVAYLDSQRARI